MTNPSRRKADRLLQIEQMLLAHPEGLTQAEIARRLGVHRSTVLRYIPHLPGHIYIDDLDGNRWKVDRSAYLMHVRFTLHEALAVHLAARLLATRSDKHNPHAATALRKLGLALERLAPHVSQHLRQSADVMDDAARRHDPVYLQALEKLTLAWAEGRKVRVWHRHHASAQVFEYTFAPYFIEPYAVGHTAHIIGFREPPGALRTFKIERIERVELLRETYEIPEGFDPRDLLRSAWGIWYTEEQPVEVILRFHPRVADRVRETRWHPSEEVQEQADGALIWRARVAETREMLPWIRGWGADCEVLEPEKLRDMLKEEARRLVGLYGTGPAMTLEDQFYAHSREGTSQEHWQKLKDHLEATGDLAFELGRHAGISELARIAGLLHDIGKYSPAFQARLRGAKRSVDHASAGAREIVRLFPNQPHNVFAELISYCIAGHHTGLPDYGSPGDLASDATLIARRDKKALEDYGAYAREIDPSALQFRPPKIRLNREHPGFSVSFLTRMVFSTLVDADWLETETYMQGERGLRGGYQDLSTLRDQFNRYVRRFGNPRSEINRRRSETLRACQEKAAHAPGFFTLTVPTGGGKTLASMAFALNHAVEQGMRRIIYVMPFTSIVEQNAGAFRRALGPFGSQNVLEHHSNLDWEAQSQPYDDETGTVIEKLKLAAENWDIPIVVTTNVQFFESLFASQKSRARKLHNVAKSVIIFDEAQLLPREYLKPSMLALSELVDNYGASVVFCTATQPALNRFFPESLQFIELAPDPQGLYEFYRRVAINDLGQLEDQDLLERLVAHEQVLCIVNTRRHARGLFEALDGDGRFHLSTLMCPVHRRKTLSLIRRRLESDQSCRVISTQVMEAGIDIDFPFGYRAMAGLDSIIQAAGRVNRERKKPSAQMFVFNPRTALIRRTPIYIKQTASVAQTILREFDDDPTSLDAIGAYYDLLYTLQDERSFDSRGILAYLDKGPARIDFDFRTAAENFRLIDERTVGVIIPYDALACDLIKALTRAEYPGQLVRQLQAYAINIYESEFHALQSRGVIHTMADRYHVLLHEHMQEYYSDETGLALPESRDAEAIFFD